MKTLAWLAGFLEAEGCFSFGIHHRKRDDRYFSWITVSAVSTDEDIIRKAAILLNASVTRCQNRKGSFGTKTIYGLSISGNKATYFLPLLLPFMGDRRGDRIRKMLLHWENRAHRKCNVQKVGPKHWMPSSEEENNIAWLSGFLEGEGSFLLRTAKREKSKTPRVDVAIYAISTDEDVLRKAAFLLGGVVRSRSPRGISKKVQWETVISGKRAIPTMLAILPYMGERRQNRLKELISLWDERSVREMRESNLPPICHPDRKHAANGLCIACYAKQKRPERANYFREYRRKNRAARTAYNRDWRKRHTAERLAA